MSSSWPLTVCFSAGCDQCITKSGSRTALLYIKILTPISRVSAERKLEPDSLSMGLCPALGHQLEFLLWGHTVKIFQERQQLCIFKEMGDFFLRTRALGTVTPLGPESYLWTRAHRGRRCANSLQEKKDKLAP